MISFYSGCLKWIYPAQCLSPIENLSKFLITDSQIFITDIQISELKCFLSNFSLTRLTESYKIQQLSKISLFKIQLPNLGVKIPQLLLKYFT